jgi:hypothetical protein
MGGRLGTVHETGKGFLGHGVRDPLIFFAKYKTGMETGYTSKVMNIYDHFNDRVFYLRF